MEITNVVMEDLPSILRIEHLGFTALKAGTEEQYRDRIAKLGDTFLVGKINNEVVGFIVGPATKEPFVEDWMYEKTPQNLNNGGHQLIFTIAIDPQYRGQGLGSQLLLAMEKICSKQKSQDTLFDKLRAECSFL
ncbi:GNAT family N-acetyltransferase [Lactiplantibacillus paraplantarum]|uniref:GNAT family N-acetyltransferase n=1 Tax=Lactiplantibacillus paraplantarum TaxID=60520 RepID=A0A4Q9XZ24_9LACO|nr:GNAT family N-acetyltransferase [Lactiplantibacillus paraplantarum]